MMEYAILSHEYPTVLEEKVRAAIAEGWVPSGGLAIGGSLFFQVMIRMVTNYDDRLWSIPAEMST